MTPTRFGPRHIGIGIPLGHVEQRMARLAGLRTRKTAVLATAAEKTGPRKPLTASAGGGEGLGDPRIRSVSLAARIKPIVRGTSPQPRFSPSRHFPLERFHAPRASRQDAQEPPRLRSPAEALIHGLPSRSRDPQEGRFMSRWSRRYSRSPEPPGFGCTLGPPSPRRPSAAS